MLDFHLIGDTTSQSAIDSGNLEHAGGIEYNDFKYLKRLKIIEDWQDYYGDFRWTKEQVIQKFELLINIYNANNLHKSRVKTPESIMLEILQKAINANSGLIAYAD